MREFWKIWKYALGSFNDEPTKKYDNSLTPKHPKMPDFKVSTEIFSVERGHMERYGDTNDYHYGIQDEKQLSEPKTE